MMLDVNDLHVAIAGHTIVDHVSFHLDGAERVGLIGASGSGKSMVAKSLLGLQPATAAVTGSISIAGHQIAGVPDTTLADLRGRVAGMIFQNPATALNPVLPVGQQIALPLRLHYALSRRDLRHRVAAMLEKVQLPASTASAFPHELSGGQQQRVAIATALATSPKLIIADEPTTALDAVTQRQIVELLVSLVDDANVSLLFITHDFSVLANTVQRCYVLDEGRIVEEGGIDAIVNRPNTEQTARLVSAASELSFHAFRGQEPREGGRHE